jgi:hypothetical protein
MDMATTLQRLHGILQQHSGDSAQWLSGLLQMLDDEDALYHALNSKRMWGGAGSIANEALADNPGMDDWSWQTQIREFRELMIELGEHLQARGNAYPDIGAWIMAFSNWNQSEV